MQLIETLQALADLNRHGLAFLAAFGVTWVICGVLWLRITERHAAFATMIQGMVGLPLALGLTYAMGAFGGDRPVDPVIDELSTLIAMSQLLGLPLVIYLYATERHLLVPFGWASVVAMHFVLYAWLYRAPLYIVMAVAISIGTLIVMALAERRADVTAATASAVCFLTGSALLVTGFVLQLV